MKELDVVLLLEMWCLTCHYWSQVDYMMIKSSLMLGQRCVPVSGEYKIQPLMFRSQT